MAPLPKPRAIAGPLVQSAANFSEGRRLDVMGAIADAISSSSDSALVDWSSDYDHNRMVATILGSLDGVLDSILLACDAAVRGIDLRDHRGVHPRCGAVDVIPLVPVRGVTMNECVEASFRLGKELASRYGLPVYLYERSARSGRPILLPELRKGGFEGLSREPLIGVRAPDFGPSSPHPTAGIVIVGARGPLAAYNVNLEAEDSTPAKRIAAGIRSERRRNPVLVGVRALGLTLPSRGISQVSMNLTQLESTTISSVFEYVREKAAEFEVSVLESEVIGLIPRASLEGRDPESILWKRYDERQILESWL